MGQYFQIVNIDHQESTHHLGKIGEGMINAPYDEDLCFAIQVHYKPTYESFLRNRIEDFRSRVPRKGDLGVLESLPAELIAMMSSYMGLISSIAFGVTNSQILALAYPSISEQMMDFWSDTLLWSHCRIVYIGDYAEDLPDSCLSEEERLELAAEFDEADADDLYTIAASFEHNGLGRRSLAVGDELRGKLPYKEYYQYRCLYNLPTPPKDWGVLVNTTKKQFINASTIGVDLQTMIVPLIIWAGEDTKRFGVNNQGPWAGDRIAIISEEDFATRVAEDGPSVWLDIIDKGLELQNQWTEAFGVRDLDMSLPY